MHLAKKKDREESQKEIKTLIMETRNEMKDQHKICKKLKN